MQNVCFELKKEKSFVIHLYEAFLIYCTIYNWETSALPQPNFLELYSCLLCDDIMHLCRMLFISKCARRFIKASLIS